MVLTTLRFYYIYNCLMTDINFLSIFQFVAFQFKPNTNSYIIMHQVIYTMTSYIYDDMCRVIRVFPITYYDLDSIYFHVIIFEYYSPNVIHIIHFCTCISGNIVRHELSICNYYLGCSLISVL